MKLRSLTIILMLMITIIGAAQKRKQTPRHKTQVSPEVAAWQERLDRMTMATQRIMVIDSIVVDKNDFLQHYYLNPEEGHIDSYSHFFNTQQQPNAYVYLNAIGNQCILSQEDEDGIINLYESDKEGNKWTKPRLLQGVNDAKQFFHVNYPFMMPDGVSLYFAAEGDESLGGYDIFVTTYDTEEDRFLTPENIGMPFNSEANDYMMVIDEYDRIGWFATDRGQEDGKVCIYTFVPSDVRQTYDPETYSKEQITNFARITDITETWVSPDIDQALERLEKAKARQKKNTDNEEFTFVINDDVDYHKLSDFKAKGNAQRYLQLVKLRSQQTALQQAIERVRAYYSGATADEKREMAPEIIATEQQQHQIHIEIHNLEKIIRNEENITLRNTQK